MLLTPALGQLIGTFVFACLLAAGSFAPAQDFTPASPAAGTSARSSSGQFVASARMFGRTPANVYRYATNRGFLRVEPTLVTVSAERIKQLIWRDLAYPGPAQDKIYLSVRTARTTNDPVLLASEKLKDGWTYGVELPEVVDRVRYVRVITRAVLQVMANRRATKRGGEIPAWLVEGFTQKLLAAYELEIILSAPTLNPGAAGLAATMVNARRENPLKRAREDLLTQPGLSFQQLSWPAEEDITGPKGAFYRLCAQVFVSELLNLPDGTGCMKNFLSNLPDFLNWQFAFLRAFNAHFQRPLDVEKWWALDLAHFSGRNLAEAWSAEESWVKLDELLGAPANVRSVANELPKRSRVTLQMIVRDWPPIDQSGWLKEISLQLQMFRLRTPPEFTPIVDAYRGAIDNYLERCGRLKGDTYSRSQRKIRRLVAATMEELDRLDVQRQALRPPPATVPVAAGRGQ